MGCTPPHKGALIKMVIMGKVTRYCQSSSKKSFAHRVWPQPTVREGEGGGAIRQIKAGNLSRISLFKSEKIIPLHVKSAPAYRS